jgi:transposase
MVPPYGWAAKGQRARGTVPAGHRRHHTLLSTLTPHGMGPSWLIEGSVDQQVFDTFLTTQLIPTLQPGQTVILDNASIHKGRRTQALIEAAGAQVQFLPTCAPQFNPIEQAFAKLKQYLRTVQARTPETLEAAIKAGTNAITPADAVGYFRGAGYPLPGQLPGKSL